MGFSLYSLAIHSCHPSSLHLRNHVGETLWVAVSDIRKYNLTENSLTPWLLQIFLKCSLNLKSGSILKMHPFGTGLHVPAF